MDHWTAGSRWTSAAKYQANNTSDTPATRFLSSPQDVLQETLKLKHLSDYFPQFVGDNTVEDACKFFAEKFNAVWVAHTVALAADTMKEYNEDETWEVFNKRRAAAAAAAAADAADPASAARRREELALKGARQLDIHPSIGFETEIVNKVLVAVLWARSPAALLL